MDLLSFTFPFTCLFKGGRSYTSNWAMGGGLGETGYGRVGGVVYACGVVLVDKAKSAMIHSALVCTRWEISSKMSNQLF